MIQGNLFTRDFLLEGITNEPAWRGLTPETTGTIHKQLAALLLPIAQQRTPNEAETEAQLIYPTLRLLGWDQLLMQQNQSASGRTDVPDALLFAHADACDRARHLHAWQRFEQGTCLVEAKRWNRPLDRSVEGRDKRAGDEGVPSNQILRYLRRADDTTHGRLRWGMLTNGRLWRLYWQGAVSVSEDFFEVDLGKVFALPGCVPDLLDDRRISADDALKLFLLFFGRQAFLPDSAGRTFHQIARQQGERWEEKVARDLSRVVFDRVFPVLAEALGHYDSPPQGARDAAWLGQVREAALILLYRLLFVLYAEDRDLLPNADGPYGAYSLSRLRNEVAEVRRLGRTASQQRGIYWARLNGIFSAIAKGDDALGVPPYNGGLFEAAAAPLLGRVELPDSVIADIVFMLSHVQGERGAKYVNYRDLSVQQLGSIYERILEFGLRVDETGAVVVDRNDAERHDSGSYYTPEALVSLIITRTVGPLVTQASEAFARAAETLAGDRRPKQQRLDELARHDPATALLDLRICDPAMGSGHFLVSVVDWLANRVLDAVAEAAGQVVWGEYVSPLLARIAGIRQRIQAEADAHGWPIIAEQLDDRHVVRRMILKRVIFGVDKNKFAVELAKVSLWLHTFTVGAPLSFLDHHLRCGDSIVGAWVAPVLALMARGGKLFGGEVARLENIATRMTEIEEITDNDVIEVGQSRQIFDAVHESTRQLDAFFSLVAACPALGIDLHPDADVRAPRYNPADLRKTGAEMKKITAAERQQAIYDRAAAFRALLDGSYGDPLRIATGELPIVAPDGDGGLLLPGAVGESIERRRVAAKTVADAHALDRRERFLHWQIAFPNIWRGLTQADAQGGFDAIVGNPPYVRQERLAAIKPALQAGYPKTYAGMADLYVYFFEQGLRLVRPGGRVGYVVTNKWLKAGYAEGLRAMLVDPERAETEELVDFGHARAFFPGTDVFPNVVVLRRPDGSAASDTLTVAVPSRETLPDERLPDAVAKARFSIARSSLRPEGWALEQKPVMDLLEKIRRAGVPLAEYAGVKPYRGVLTGFNEAFLIDTPTRDRLVAADPASAEVIKPYLRGQDVQRWSAPKSQMHIIFARRGIQISHYPAILAHLSQYRKQLEPKPFDYSSEVEREEWPGRKPGPYEWYEIQDSVSYFNLLETPKIVYPDITWENSFAIDAEGLYANNTTYFLPTDDDWISAVLNSPIGWWRSWRTAQRGKDDALRYFNSFLEGYPIPQRPKTSLQINDIVKLISTLESAKGALADWLRLEFGVNEPGKHLQHPERLDADAFAAAVRKTLPRRRTLTAADIARLKREHADTIEPARQAAAQVKHLERRLSDLVNTAYGLTPDDVRLMWQTAPPRMPPFPPANLQLNNPTATAPQGDSGWSLGVHPRL